MKPAVAALCLMLASPALAQDWSVVEFMARDAKKDDPAKAYRGAVAICLVGQGDAAATAALFEKAGWTLTADPEAGVNEFASPLDDIHALAADDGSFCAAYAETLGTDRALGNLQIIGAAAGLSFDSLIRDDDCLAFALAPGIQGEVTSSGNDPVCHSDTSSSVRFLFDGAS